MYGLVVAGAYLADLSDGMTDDLAHRLRLLRIVDDFATKDGVITHGSETTEGSTTGNYQSRSIPRDVDSFIESMEKLLENECDC